MCLCVCGSWRKLFAVGRSQCGFPSFGEEGEEAERESRRKIEWKHLSESYIVYRLCPSAEHRFAFIMMVEIQSPRIIELLMEN